jgi:starch-binding outer membrane protein, SusD/RagB family
MHTIYKTTRNTLFALTIVLIQAGCSNLLEPTAQGIVELDKLFTTKDGIITAVNGSFAPLLTIYNGPVQQLTDLASDDAWTWRNEIDPDVYIIQSNSTYTQNVWVPHYLGITRANAVIDNIGNVTNFPDAIVKNAVEGQAKFIRAYYYFNLVRLYGDVPLIVKQIKSRDDSEQPRAGIKDIYTQIKADLTDAIALLPATYSGGAGMEKGRPTTYSAAALKALVHLELEEWDAVKTATTDLLNRGSLPASYAGSFNGSSENGTSTFFEVQYGGVASGTTASFSSGWTPTSFGGGASILPTDDDLKGSSGGLSAGNGIVQAFEPGDLRKAVDIATYDQLNFLDPTRPKGSLYYINKYYNAADPRGLSTWNYPLIRYSEILLTRAEALNEIGFTSGGEALTLVNQVRTKAGLPLLTSASLTTQQLMRDAIRKERRIELAFETKRYFDLNRWGVLTTSIQLQMDISKRTFPVDRLITHPVTGKKYFLYPIPATEFINNARLGKQNPGYN